ncbi:hypothetical protein R3P38DRAFT_2816477 [Favolaschia claudopus]|uniref:Uncharacterized protein n=1 Tax=Favolaschia claudopus TaxID=2862362 RepID=A0AAV9YZ20_9AGAR
MERILINMESDFLGLAVYETDFHPPLANGNYYTKYVGDRVITRGPECRYRPVIFGEICSLPVRVGHLTSMRLRVCLTGRRMDGTGDALAALSDEGSGKARVLRADANGKYSQLKVTGDGSNFPFALGDTVIVGTSIHRYTDDFNTGRQYREYSIFAREMKKMRIKEAATVLKRFRRGVSASRRRQVEESLQVKKAACRSTTVADVYFAEMTFGFCPARLVDNMAFHTALLESTSRKSSELEMKFCLRLAESVCVVQVILNDLNSGEQHRIDTCPPAAGKHSVRRIYVPPQNRPLVDADLDSGPEYIEYLLKLDRQRLSVQLNAVAGRVGVVGRRLSSILVDFRLATSFKVEEKALGLVLVEQFGKHGPSPLRTASLVLRRVPCKALRTGLLLFVTDLVLLVLEVGRDDPEVLERSGRDFRLSINVLGVESDSMSSLEDVIASTDEAGSSSEEANCVAEFLTEMERRLNQDPFPDKDRDRFGPGRTRNCLSFPNAAVYVTWSVASVVCVYFQEWTSVAEKGRFVELRDGELRSTSGQKKHVLGDNVHRKLLGLPTASICLANKALDTAPSVRSRTEDKGSCSIRPNRKKMQGSTKPSTVKTVGCARTVPDTLIGELKLTAKNGIPTM